MRKLTLPILVCLCVAPLLSNADAIPDGLEIVAGEAMDIAGAALDAATLTETNKLNTVDRDIEKQTKDIIQTLTDNDNAWTTRRETPNPYLPSNAPINTLKQGGVTQGLAMASTASQKELNNNLQSYAAHIGPAKYTLTMKKSGDSSKVSLDTISSKLKSSDTLSLSPTANINPLNKNAFQSLSFDNFIDPMSYSSDDEKNSQNYISLISQNYESPTFGIDFTKLNTTLGEMSITDRSSWIKNNLISSTAYQTYLADLHSYFAIKNMVTSNLNYLAKLRATPKEGGDSVMTQESSAIIKLANKADFYSSLRTMSPTNLLQTITLIQSVNASINQQLQQTEQRILLTRSLILQLSLSKNKNHIVNPTPVNQIIKTASINSDIT